MRRALPLIFALAAACQTTAPTPTVSAISPTPSRSPSATIGPTVSTPVETFIVETPSIDGPSLQERVETRIATSRHLGTTVDALRDVWNAFARPELNMEPFPGVLLGNQYETSFSIDVDAGQLSLYGQAHDDRGMRWAALVWTPGRRPEGVAQQVAEAYVVAIRALTGSDETRADAVLDALWMPEGIGLSELSAVDRAVVVEGLRFHLVHDAAPFSSSLYLYVTEARP